MKNPRNDLRSAYVAVHRLQSGQILSERDAALLSSVRIYLANLYPSTIGKRPGEDDATMRLLGRADLED